MVWGYTDVSDSLVNVHVQRLRAKFDESWVRIVLSRRSVALATRFRPSWWDLPVAKRNLFIRRRDNLIVCCEVEP